MKILALVLVLLLAPASVQATITVAETTSGNATTAQSFTTASVSPEAGKLLIFYLAWRSTGCFPVLGGSGTITGLNVTWTLIQNLSVGGGVSNHYMWRAVSDGSTGSISGTGNGTNCTTMVWSLMELGGVNQTTNQGVVTSATNNNTACNNCTLVLGWAAYTDARNTQITSCVVGDLGAGSSATFTMDTSGGWAASTPQSAGSGVDYRQIVTEWLIVKGSDNQADCGWSSMSGVGTATLITAEIAFQEAGVKHKVNFQ